VRSDGGLVLPDLAETAVLHDLGLVRSDDLPMIAARWLASDLVDTDAVRELAGHDRGEVWSLESLLRDALEEAGVATPTDLSVVERIAVEWVAETWRTSGDTRWAVGTLAWVGEHHLELNLGFFIGLDDEWDGGWGRLPPDLKREAETELDAVLRGTSR
jgi:hypothetical protein